MCGTCGNGTEPLAIRSIETSFIAIGPPYFQEIPNQGKILTVIVKLRFCCSPQFKKMSILSPHLF